MQLACPADLELPKEVAQSKCLNLEAHPLCSRKWHLAQNSLGQIHHHARWRYLCDGGICASAQTIFDNITAVPKYGTPVRFPDNPWIIKVHRMSSAGVGCCTKRVVKICFGRCKGECGSILHCSTVLKD
jgi:hypothetical protein